MRNLLNIILLIVGFANGFVSKEAFADFKIEKIEDLEVVNQDGKKVNFYKDLVKGKRVGINFIYTTCKMICLPMSAVFSSTAKMLAKEEDSEKYELISVTLDPENDTPEKLKEYAKKHNREKGWTLVTGDPDKVRKLLRQLKGFEQNIENHGAFTVVGNDSTGEWRKVGGIKPPKELYKEMIKLKKNEKVESISSEKKKEKKLIGHIFQIQRF